jgi:signal transduction histidine kinase
VYRSLANIYKSQNDFKQALEMNRQALELRKKLKDKRTLASAYMEYGLVYDAAHRTAEAKAMLLSADSVAQTVTDPVTKVEIGLALAEVLFKEGSLAEAAGKADEVLLVVTENTNQKLYLRALLLKARFFIQQRKFAEAEKNLLRIEQSSSTTGNLALQRDACFYLTEVANRTGRPAEAADYQSQYDYLTEKLENSDLSRQIMRLEFQLALEKMESENAILKANEVANSQIIAKQRFENLTLLIGVMFVTLVAGLSWWGAHRNRRISSKLARQNEYILLQRDEIQKQNEVLQANYRTLEALDEEKTTLMNIVAHDLKAPLNRILGLAHLMALDGNEPQQQEEYLRMLKQAAKGGLDLITDLLDVNQIEASKQPHFEQVNLAALSQERMAHYQLLAVPKNIRVRVQQQGEGKLFTDPQYLVRIVDNLVSNAIKFSKPGSEVNIGCELSDEALKITVADQGPGFAEEDKKFLFQKFRKLSARPTAGESSNGLGLAIVKILVDRLHGHIELESEPGRGSRFSITIPMQG